MKKIFIQLSGFDSSADVSQLCTTEILVSVIHEKDGCPQPNSLTNHTVIMSLGADGQFVFGRRSIRVFWAGSVGGAVKPTNI